MSQSHKKSDTHSHLDVFVKNLGGNLDEKTISTMFSRYGQLTNVLVNPRGYAVVSFREGQAALNAIKDLNGQKFKGKELYVDYHQSRDDRIVALAGIHLLEGRNLIVKHVPKNIDKFELERIFSEFGTVISTTVRTKKSLSLGYGYVCFSTQEEAQKALLYSRNMGITVLGEKLIVEVYEKKQYPTEEQSKQTHDFNSRRSDDSAQEDSHNHGHRTHSTEQGCRICVKNLKPSVAQKLSSLASKYGTVVDTQIIGDNGVSLWHGYVTFSSQGEAEKAYWGMDGLEVAGTALEVVLCEEERAENGGAAGRSRGASYSSDDVDRESVSSDENDPPQKRNLYVKNIDPRVTVEDFKHAFLIYGNVKSVKIVDGPHGKFGFVSMSSNLEATRAILDMNGRQFMSQKLKLFVCFHQTKAEREEFLKQQHLNRLKELAERNSSENTSSTGTKPADQNKESFTEAKRKPQPTDQRSQTSKRGRSRSAARQAQGAPPVNSSSSRDGLSHEGPRKKDHSRKQKMSAGERMSQDVVSNKARSSEAAPSKEVRTNSSYGKMAEPTQTPKKPQQAYQRESTGAQEQRNKPSLEDVQSGLRNSSSTISDDDVIDAMTNLLGQGLSDKEIVERLKKSK